MNNENFQTFFDCGFSKMSAGVFNKSNQSETFYAASKFLVDHSDLDLRTQDIITSLEKGTNEYIDNVHLMLDSPKMLSIGISVFKKLDGSKLSSANVQFLIQEAKQQILKNYRSKNILHIIVNNYKIDNIDYSHLPSEINCFLISLDMIFICAPSDLVLYFKNIFLKLNISIKQVICSSYAKSMSYKNKLALNGYISFIDIGFHKTSIISYFNDKVLFLDVLPIGGNHITQDISKILKIDLEKSENLKINYDKEYRFSSNENFSSTEIQKIIFARVDEILELCSQSIRSNIFTQGHFKVFLMGEGSKILGNHYENKISFLNDIEFLEENNEYNCQAGFNLGNGLNKQEVVVIPKKQIKQGFFEKLFNLFG